MTYKGRFVPQNISKYEGNPMRIQYRSLWERQTFRWLDANPNVFKWSSEEVVVPYMCRTDNRKHLYFPDLKVTFKNGATYLIEIKPKREMMEPKRKARTKAQKTMYICILQENAHTLKWFLRKSCIKLTKK
jgi:hypothetical protein